MAKTTLTGTWIADDASGGHPENVPDILLESGSDAIVQRALVQVGDWSNPVRMKAFGPIVRGERMNLISLDGRAKDINTAPIDDVHIDGNTLTVQTDDGVYRLETIPQKERPHPRATLSGIMADVGYVVRNLFRY